MVGISQRVIPARSSGRFSTLFAPVREFAYGSWEQQKTFCAQLLTGQAPYSRIEAENRVFFSFST